MTRTYDVLRSPTSDLQDGVVIATGLAEEPAMEHVDVAPGLGTWWHAVRVVEDGVVYDWRMVAEGATVGAGPERLGLHVTEDELAIWRDRAVAGPYRGAWDQHTASPGDWERIVTHKDALTLDNYYDPESTPPVGSLLPASYFTQAHRVRDAAFWHLVRYQAEDTSVMRDLARDWLIEQTANKVDFSDRSIWPIEHYWESNPSFELAEWATSLLHAYDYLRAAEREGGPALFTQQQRADVAAWFYHAADYWQHDSNASLDNLLGAGRWDDPPTYGIPSAGEGETAFMRDDASTQTIRHPHQFMNNRKAQILRLVGVVGEALTVEGVTSPAGSSPGRTVADLRSSGELWVRAWLHGGVSPRGFFGDYNRWTSADPNLGWAYTNAPVGTALYLADLYARRGDSTCFDLATREGYHGSECLAEDPDKTLLWAAEEHARYSAEAFDRYGTDDSGNRTDSYKIKSRHDVGGSLKQWVSDITIACANLRWQSDLIRRVVERDPGGAYPNIPDGYPTSGLQAGDFGWMGTGRTLPGVLFMFSHPDRPISEWPDPYGGQ